MILAPAGDALKAIEDRKVEQKEKRKKKRGYVDVDEDDESDVMSDVMSDVSGLDTDSAVDSEEE
jgi:hypothetical protein